MEIINPIIFNASMLTSASVPETDHPVWSGGVYLEQAKVMLNHRRFEAKVEHTSLATDKKATVTMTIAAPCVVTLNAHGFAAGTEVMFLTNGTLPAPLVAGKKYYVQAPTTNTFNISETYAGVNITTTGTQSGTHTLIAYSTSPLTNDDMWLDLGSTNKFAAFDEKFGSQTTATGSLTFELTPNMVIDSLAVLNCIGSEITITSTCAGMTPYSKTFKLTSGIGVYSWRTYFTAPIVAEKDVVITDLKPFKNQVITITITGTDTVAIGNIAMGALIDLGELEYSARIGITDYSKKITDPEFGTTELVKRDYAKRFGGTIIVPNDFVDQLAGILASLRATPVIWIGAHYSALVVWGWYKDFEIDLKTSSVSYCGITIEGLV